MRGLAVVGVLVLWMGLAADVEFLGLVGLAILSGVLIVWVLRWVDRYVDRRERERAVLRWKRDAWDAFVWELEAYGFTEPEIRELAPYVEPSAPLDHQVGYALRLLRGDARREERSWLFFW
ncbi:MAG: hypothetical protein OXR67_14320 [Chloroflexota bacterium]|nr:hypothetical protein [Chloroflexota bacterium]